MTKEELQRFESLFPSEEKREWFEEAIKRLAETTELRKALDKKKYNRLSMIEAKAAEKIFQETEALEHYLTSGVKVLNRAFSINIKELNQIDENRAFVFKKFGKRNEENSLSSEFANLQKKYIAKSLGYEDYYSWYSEWVDSRKYRESDRIDSNIKSLEQMFSRNATSEEVCDEAVDIIIGIANSNRIGMNLKLQKINELFNCETMKIAIEKEENR